MVDTHAHLYDSKIVRDLHDIVAASKRAGIQKVFMPNLELSTVEDMMVVADLYPTFCHAMMGLHPCSVQEDNSAVLTEMEDWLYRHPFIGVGEIGLDFSQGRGNEKEQVKVLKRQLKWAKEYDIPVALHARDSLDEVIEIVGKSEAEKGVFHCFTGSLEQAQKIIDMGFYLGIGGIVTFENSDLREIVKAVDLKHLVLETDSPYLTPHPHRGKLNYPYYLPFIAATVAKIKNIPLEVVKKQTMDQAIRLFIKSVMPVGYV